MAGESTTIIVAQAEGEVAHEGAMAPEAGAEHTTEEVHAAEGHSEVFPPFDPSSFATQLIWLAITFGVLYIVLSRIALPRIGGILEERKARIDGDLQEAERLRLETDKAVADYETALAEARRNAQKIAETNRDAIKADIDGKRKAVESELATHMSDAESRIQATKTAALVNVDAIAAETAQVLVERLSGSVSEADALAAVADAKGTL